MFKKVKGFLFANTTTRQTVAKNTFWLAVSQIGGRLMRAVIIIYAARVLGATEWGTFSYAVGLVAFLTIFVDLGIGPILTREAAKTSDIENRARILSTSFFIKIVMISLGVLVVIFIAPSFTTIEKAKELLPIVAFILVFDSIREFAFSLTRALERMEWEAGLYLLTNVSIIGAGIFVLTVHPTVRAFTYAYAFGTGTGMIATLFLLRNYFSKLLSRFDYKLVKPILYSAWPFAVSGVLGGLMINTDLLFVGYFLPAAAVGYYSAAERPILLLYIIPGIISTSIFPALSRLVHTDTIKMRTVLERAIISALSLALPLAMGGIIVAPALITLVFGQEYLPAVASFQVLLLTLAFNFPTVILSNAIFAHNRQKDLISFTLIGGVSNVIFDLLFIPRFGITGSAYATLIAQGLGSAYLWIKLKRIQELRIGGHLQKIVLATCGMGLVAFLLTTLHAPLFAVLAASVTSYGLVLSLLKEPLLQEFRRTLQSQ